MKGDKLNMLKISIYDSNDMNDNETQNIDDVDFDELYQQRILKIYGSHQQSHKLPYILQRMKEHRGDMIWLHSLYVRICKKYQIDPEPVITEQSHLNHLDELLTFPAHPTFDIILRYQPPDSKQEDDDDESDKQQNPNELQTTYDGEYAIDIVLVLLHQYPHIETLLQSMEYHATVTTSRTHAIQFLNSLIVSQPQFNTLIKLIQRQLKQRREATAHIVWQQPENRSARYPEPFVDEKVTKSTKVNVCDFIKNVMDILSHPMNRDQYKLILDKYNDDQNKYSFVIMNGNSVSKYQCFDTKDECELYAKDEGLCQANIVIIDNIGCFDEEKEDKDKLSIIVRFGKLEQGEFLLGYPMKLYITKEMKVVDIYHKFIKTDDTKNIKLDSCLMNVNKIEFNDIVYEKMAEDVTNQLILFVKITMENLIMH